MLRSIAMLLVLVISLNACAQYRLVRLDDFQIPDYEPREVLIPEICEELIRRAAVEGMTRFNDAEARELNFCQQQQMIRAQEEEAAARRLEAHAAAAQFAFRVTTFALGAVIAILAWAF